MKSSVVSYFLKIFLRISTLFSKQPKLLKNLKYYFTHILVLVFAVVVSSHFFNYLSDYIFSVKLPAKTIHFDIKAQLILSVIIWGFSSKMWGLAVCQSILIGIMYLGHGAKIAILGGPILPNDIVDSGMELIKISEGFELFLIVSPFILLGVVFILNYTWRPKTQAFLISGLIASWTLALNNYNPVINYININFGFARWDDRTNYENIGPTLYLPQQFIRFMISQAPPPAEEEVQEAVQYFSRNFSDSLAMKAEVHKNGSAPRNIHLVLLESFWDVNALTAAQFSEDPFDSKFRQLWNQGGNSKAMSPTFAGGTANSEFEALCGIPVRQRSIMFQQRLNDYLPCLPNLLAKYGYENIASHPNIPAFWNRTNAYPKLGFTNFYSKSDFIFDDLNGPFLSDISFYQQVIDKVSKRKHPEKPLFNYLLTISSHRPYYLGEKRPLIITTKSEVEDVKRYANIVRYSSREFMSYVETIHKMDPNAIIIALGDHLPSLGLDYAAYRESNILKETSRSARFKSKIDLYSTPLIVLDGINNPINVGSINIFEIPRLIFSLAGLPPLASHNVFSDFDKWRVRYIYGSHVVVNPKGVEVRCDLPDDPENYPRNRLCRKISSYIDKTRVFTNDILYGQQYSLGIFNKLAH